MDYIEIASASDLVHIEVGGAVRELEVRQTQEHG